MDCYYKNTTQFQLKEPPKRIISLVPSLTELLFELGLGPQIVGRTKFCIHPEPAVKAIPVIGGTKNLRFDTITALQPDLIIANSEENRKEDVTTLKEQFPVAVTTIYDLPSAYAEILELASITDTSAQANTLITTIKNGFAQLNGKSATPKKVLYLIWQKPYMSIGGDTFISALLQEAGFRNVMQAQQRYPTLTEAELVQTDAELLFLSSEPYPFKQKELEALQVLLPTKKIILVDGEFFSWYGSRLQHAPLYFKQLYDQI